MNGNLLSSHVKNETTYNIPLLINENVISSGISLISLWHTYADENYRVIWPRDKKKPHNRQFVGRGLHRTGVRENPAERRRANYIKRQLHYLFKTHRYTVLPLRRFIVGAILDGVTPTSIMDIPIRQQSVIYNGDIYNQELAEVSQLITSPEPIKNNLAVAFLTKIIYQWICLIDSNGKKDPQRIQVEKLIGSVTCQPATPLERSGYGRHDPL